MSDWWAYKRGEITKYEYSKRMRQRCSHVNEQWLETRRKIRREFVKRNPAKIAMQNLKRQRSQERAAPKWLTPKQWEKISTFYETAQALTASTGNLHVVDHVWPIRGATSCGLHVPWNLQVLTQPENDSKGNREPHELNLPLEENGYVESDKCFHHISGDCE